MSEPRGTQIKNLPRVNTLAGSDVIVKQKTLQNNSQTQGIQVSDVINYTKQQLSIPQILQDITDIQQQIAQIRFLGILNISNVDDDNLTFRITSPDTHIQSILNNINSTNVFNYCFDIIGLSKQRILSTEQDPNGTCWKVIFNDNFSCNVFFNYTRKYKTNTFTALGINLSNSFNRPKRFFYGTYGNYTGLFLQDTFRNKKFILHRYQTIAMGEYTASIATNIYSNGEADVDAIIKANGGSFSNDNIGTLTFTVPFANNNYTVILSSGRSTSTVVTQSFPLSINRTTTSCEILCNYSAYVNYISAKITGEVDLDLV